MDRREKLKETFKVSKAKVKEWEKLFFADHQRKPNKEEMKTAPEQIQICYKNCWKIKSYFESEAKKSDHDHPDDENSLMAVDESSQSCFPDPITSSSVITGCGDTEEAQSAASNPCKDISNTSTSTKRSGRHLLSVFGILHMSTFAFHPFFLRVP